MPKIECYAVCEYQSKGVCSSRSVSCFCAGNPTGYFACNTFKKPSETPEQQIEKIKELRDKTLLPLNGLESDGLKDFVHYINNL
jgi:hypothetical protein